jgi:hypothetical protein
MGLLLSIVDDTTNDSARSKSYERTECCSWTSFRCRQRSNFSTSFSALQSGGQC